MKLFSVGVVAKNEEKQEKQARRERERERETSGLVGKRGGPNFFLLVLPSIFGHFTCLLQTPTMFVFEKKVNDHVNWFVY